VGACPQVVGDATTYSLRGMMDWKYSANAAFFGLRRDRFLQYQPPRDLEGKLELVSRLTGVEGVELKYPADFADPPLVPRLLAHHGLELSAVNVDTKDVDHFRFGAFSARDAAARARAAALVREAMDVAADLGVGLVTTCPLADAYDYPFQIDYTEAWGRFVETVRSAVTHRSDVSLLLEYQPHEPHAHVLLSNVGKVLHVCAEVDAPNLGANLDVGHAFAAQESPAEAAALLAAKGRLRYIHTNDNTGDGGDWDMASGTVHFWHWLELLFTLDRVGYRGWFSGDVMAKHMGPVEAYETNFTMVRRMTDMVRRLGVEAIAEKVAADGNTAEVYGFLSSALGD